MIEKKDYEILNKHKQLIDRIVESKSASYIPIELINEIKKVCEQNKIQFCPHCPSVLYRAIIYVKNLIEEYEKEKRDRVQRKPAGKTGNGSKKKS